MNVYGIITAILFVLSLINHETMTILLQNEWDYLIKTKFIQHETCEVMVSFYMFLYG